MKIKKCVALGIMTLLLMSIFGIGLGTSQIIEISEVEKELFGDDEEHNLTVELRGKGNVSVEWEDDEEKHSINVTDEEMTFNITESTTVYLNASADEEKGRYFAEWEGDVPDGEEENITIEMDEDKEVTAIYEYDLTIDIEGEGNVTVEWEEDEEKHSINVTDEETFERRITHNTTVNLTASTEEEGWEFSYWGGGDVEPRQRREININITMDDAKRVRAYFETRTLDIRIRGNGRARARWNDGDEDYNVKGNDTFNIEPGTKVNLTAHPDDYDYWDFRRWGGDVRSRKREINIKMYEDKEITAIFVELFELTVDIEGEGEVDIDEESDLLYEDGTEVELTADPDEDWHFSKWGGDHPENEKRNESITIKMNANKTVEAYFSEVDTVEIDAVEIELNDNQTITAGEKLKFNATAYDEYNYTIDDNVTKFDWENIGEVNETENVAIFNKTTMGDHNVTASYEGVTSEPITVTVEPAEAVDIWIEPEEATITAGESQEYTAYAEDKYGNEFEVTENTSWSDDIDDSEWDENEITAYTAGDYWEITGEYENETGDLLTNTSTLTVDSAEAHYIVIEPDDAELKAGETQAYTATSYDEFHNEIEDVTEETEWSIDEEAGGTWDQANGIYTSEFAGEWTVTGDYNELEDTVTVTVEPADVSYVEIDPEDDQTIEAGETIEFSAEAYDEHDNLITEDDTDFTWENTDEHGLFDETTSEEEDYDVWAEYEGERSDTVTVTVEPAEVHYVEIYPADNQTVTAGEKLEFKAEAYDEYGNLITDDPEEFEWKNADDGVFEKFEAGEYEVRAEYNGESSDPVMVNNISYVKPATILFSMILTFVVGLAVYQKVGGKR